MLHRKSFSIFLISLLVVFACKSEKGQEKVSSQDITLNYATGYHISDLNTHVELSISDPWPDADRNFKYALVSEATKNSISLNTEDYNGIISTPVKRIVVTSTTHIPALELLGVEHSLIGFPGTSYISSEKTRERIDKGKVRELGNNEGINTEVLLELRPDVVVAFGVKGTNKNLELIEKAGIPVIYNGDWVEKSPLAKAEWIKFFGLLYDKEKEASEIFSKIETDYNQAKAIAKNASKQPTVLCGAMYKDIWYLPNGTSPEAQFLKDANWHYQ